MKSKARIGSHPIHPMLVCLPIGLWTFSLIADIIYLSGGNQEWRMVASYCAGGGCVGALLAALPGIIDYFFLNEPEARKTATWHMVLNLGLTFLYAFNFYLRYQSDYESAGVPFALSVVGVIALGISGWLGGHLVYVHKIGIVEDENNQNRTEQGGFYDQGSQSRQKPKVRWASK